MSEALKGAQTASEQGKSGLRTNTSLPEMERTAHCVWERTAHLPSVLDTLSARPATLPIVNAQSRPGGLDNLPVLPGRAAVTQLHQLHDGRGVLDPKVTRRSGAAFLGISKCIDVALLERGETDIGISSVPAEHIHRCCHRECQEQLQESKSHSQKTEDECTLAMLLCRMLSVISPV